MFLVSDTLRVGVVTGHIPVSKIAESITAEKILAKLKLMNTACKMISGYVSQRLPCWA
jgi:4-hydroxy-L-threonine phosphate dehydrogenase PdxA